MTLATTEEIIADIKQGKMVIITDDESRENEGDLTVAAEFVTPEIINFMVTHARGLVCMPLAADIARHLELPLMTEYNQARHRTNFTVSIEAKDNVTTGISALDRATTVLTAIAPGAAAHDLARPGHIFPLQAEDGGVLVRAGHTEASVDLAKLAGLRAGAVICEIMNADGTMARLPQLEEFARRHELKIGTIAALIAYRNQHEELIKERGQAVINTAWGTYRQYIYEDLITGQMHVVLVKGEIKPDREVLVRVQDVSFLDFLSPNPQHSIYLPEVFKLVQKQDCGVIILLNRPLANEDFVVRALKSTPVPAAKWDSKSYGVGAQILAHLGVKQMKVIGTAASFIGLQGFGIEEVSFAEKL